jgi:predicted nucleotidyltransferase component of viral defense system
MLQTNTVEPHTLQVLKKLMQVPALQSFYLVGGTCLALRYGHRTSVDLDLFSVKDFNNYELNSSLLEAGIPFSSNNIQNKIGLFGYIDKIKVDFVKHYMFSQIDKEATDDGIRMFGDMDIIAMKIFAILQRAQKKDFWDMAELLQHYSFNDCIEAYHAKYPDNQMLISIPYAITYFADAEESEDPVSLKGQTWESVKKIIQQKVNDYLK